MSKYRKQKGGISAWVSDGTCFTAGGFCVVATGHLMAVWVIDCSGVMQRTRTGPQMDVKCRQEMACIGSEGPLGSPEASCSFVSSAAQQLEARGQPVWDAWDECW